MPSGVTLPSRPPSAVPSTKSAAPPTNRFRKQTAKLSAFLETDLFHGPDRVKTTVANSIQKTPQPLPPPWLPSVPMRTPAKPTAQPRVFAGVIRSALP